MTLHGSHDTLADVAAAGPNAPAHAVPEARSTGDPDGPSGNNRSATQITLDGSTLTAAGAAALARRSVRAEVDPAARARMLRARAVAEQVVAGRRVYGHTTGVGANRTTDLAGPDADGHGMRLLRSHSGGVGAPVPAEQTRAMLAVRLNQILGAGSAVSAAVADRLAEALGSGHVPLVHALGSVGTADLSALAELGLTLAGELPWRQGEGEGPAPAAIALDTWDALPLMSSSALTIGQTALAHTDTAALLDLVPLIAALSLTAVRGSTEPYAAAVHSRRPHRGAVRTADRMRSLLEPVGWTPALVQDPFGFRCLPQVHGAALDALDALDAVLDVELIAAAENPLLSLDPADYHHHGGFHQASLALALDQARLAVLGTAQLSTARLGVLAAPSFTGLPAFLAEDAEGSSGIMIVEYAAASALAELRGAAQPVTLGHAVLSRGVEEHASFAATGARRLTESVGHLRLVLACELLAAVRALRMQRRAPADRPSELGRFQRAAERVLDPGTADRKLTADVEAATALLDRWAAGRR